MTHEPAIVGAVKAAPPRPPNSQDRSQAESLESLIVALIKEARRQLAHLSTSKTGGDTLDAVTNKENVKLRAINVQTLANIVEIVRKVLELQLQLEQMGSFKSARKVRSARESLQRKMARVVAELNARSIDGNPDG